MQNKMKRETNKFPDYGQMSNSHPGITLEPNPHSATKESILHGLASKNTGISNEEAQRRLEMFGHNAFPSEKTPGLFIIFINQFRSPLIYVLLVAALVSVSIQEYSDALFIFAVLVVNAIIGTIQEYSAQHAAASLKEFVPNNAQVIRDGETYEINAEQLVPGDIVLLESGNRSPADIRLTNSHEFEVDESLLTGESQAVIKNAELLFDADTAIGDRLNMVFSGTIVCRGRARGVVVNTSFATELGKIAKAVLGRRTTKPPLLIRMERFTHRVALVVAVAAILMAVVSLLRGMAFEELFLLSVALAVSAIPEGLPVALTVALSIGMRRMAKRNVIVRKLVAVESLGSCTFIATDKTGTLTLNQLTARKIVFPDQASFEITGESRSPVGEIVNEQNSPEPDNPLLLAICRTAVLANEATLAQKNSGWVYHGDAVDVALLVMAHKVGIIRATELSEHPETGFIPFESENLFSASINTINDKHVAHVKGAAEKVLLMCNQMESVHGPQPINVETISEQAHAMASQGYRVLALAHGDIDDPQPSALTISSLNNLVFIALVGLIDPLRQSARPAIEKCQRAGIHIAMLTGDHPTTALTIARDLNLAQQAEQVVTGPQIKHALQNGDISNLVKDVSVFARVEPQQKLDIVKALQNNGHFVAVSGDGANDAPAMRFAHVGVAMGKSGTDIARETADIIITDDDFSSIVSGVEEGRISYANVRKVIFLLISTGAAEIVLFILALITQLPLPLLAVQLLWLNLVTNGIQDVALAFEPGEGNELDHPPRKPVESIFNRLMIERVLVTAFVIGTVAFLCYWYFLFHGYSVDEARNATLLLMVLFENIHVFNSRSETKSAFKHNPCRNPILLIGTVCAQLIHIGAMYTPWLSDVLSIEPISLSLWLDLLLLAFTILLAMEIHKWSYNRRQEKTRVVDH